MDRIVVFGAGGRAGRRIVAEAVDHGHQVTAVVRDPARHDFPADVTVAAGDVTDADSVAAAAAGHDVAISTVYRADVDAREFYASAARALLDGLKRAGTERLLVVGIGSLLETAPGVRVLDAPDFPAEARVFSLGHAAGLEVLQAGELDWVMFAPPPVVLGDGDARAGRYRVGGVSVLPASEGFSYSDLAVVVVREVGSPSCSRSLVAVGYSG
ncbi:NAD(P)-dependent oxidoreductase [Amycolatopsis nigrescens]|uniref:NAD(P)-dependent oxidoreductase n=1 Tax=Amycolatopsis nigrescens TaxID=381445 RepID=UPI00037F1028|nr:NAD(P)H-binding protein [Amycolatopsis nigrescens]